VGGDASSQGFGEGAAGPVALKVFHPEWAGDLDFSRELLADTERAKQFEHPTAVRLDGVGREGRVLFMASELVAGQTLDSLLRKARVEDRPLDQRLVAALMARVAEVLKAAHALEPPLVHGRLSVRDILIDERGGVRLLGLGTGRALRRVPPSPGRLPFVSPEVLRSQVPTPRSDVYSLAVVLYDGLTGKVPFRRSQPDEIRKAILHGDVSPIRPTSLQIDPAIGDWVMEALVPRAEVRPAGLDEIQRMLAAAGEGADEALGPLMAQLFGPEAEGLQKMIAALGGERSTPPTQADDIPIDEAPAVETDDLVPGSGDVPPSSPSVPAATGADPSAAPISSTPAADGAARPEGERAAPTDAPRPPPSSASDAPPVTVARIPLTPTWAGTGSDAPAPAPAGTTDDAPPTQVSRYRLVRRLSTDGPIDEYEAHDPNLGREVNLRLLTPSRTTEMPVADRVRLFKRESRLASACVAPILPRLYDAGRADDRYFAVYEAREGVGLAETLSEGHSVDPEHLVRELGQGLELLHGRGIVVGELRPASVRVSPSGRLELARLSRAFPAHQGPHPLLSKAPPWAPPEFARTGTWSFSTDQYALGLLAVRVASGRSPAWIEGRAVSVDDLRRQGAGMDDTVARVVVRMLQPDPNHRYAHMAEALADLPASEAGPATGAGVHPDADLVRVLAELCHRSAGLSVGARRHRQVQDAALVAAAVARRRGFSAEVARRVMMTAALRALARRARLPVLGPEFRSLIPVAVRDLVRAVAAPPRPSGTFTADDQWTGDLSQSSMQGSDVAEQEVEIVRLAEAFAEGRAYEGHQGVELQLASLRAHFSTEIVDTLEEHLAELVDRGRRRSQGRVLLAGSGLRFFGDALTDLGLELLRTEDGHQAWEFLRGQTLAGVVLSDGLAGRDSLSLIQLCRAHPNLSDLPIWLVCDELDEAARDQAKALDAVPLAGPNRFDELAVAVGERFGTG
jgi:serine/threonine-protein kinase